MTTEEIEVKIDKHGRVQLTVIGTKGPDCAQRTEGLIEALGGEIEEYIQSDEFYAEPAAEQNEQRLR